MNRNRLVLLRQFLVTQLNYWSVFPLVVAFLVLAGDFSGRGNPTLLPWIPLGFFPFGMYLSRRFCERFYLLVGTHILLVLPAFFLPAEHGAARFLYIVTFVGFAIYSFYVRFSTESFQDSGLPLPVGVLFAGVSLFLAQYIQHSEWSTLIICILLLVVGLHFIISYLESFLNFLLVNESSTGQMPEREIFQSGFGQVLGFTLAGTFFLFVTSNFVWLKSVLELLKKPLELLFRLWYFLAMLGPEAEEGSAVLPPGGGGQLALLESGETFWLWDLLWYLAVIAICLGLLYFLIKWMIKFLRYLYTHWFHSKERFQAPLENAFLPDKREKLSLSDRPKILRLSSLFERLSYTERIRRTFKKQVLKYQQDILGHSESRSPESGLALYTARECAKYFDVPNLATVYEKARYSAEECTQEDWKRMKTADGIAID